MQFLTLKARLNFAERPFFFFFFFLIATDQLFQFSLMNWHPTFESVVQERYWITQRGIIQSNCFVDTEGDIGDGLLVACWGRKSISVLRSLWKTTPAGTQECWLCFRWSTQRARGEVDTARDTQAGPQSWSQPFSAVDFIQGQLRLCIYRATTRLPVNLHHLHVLYRLT